MDWNRDLPTWPHSELSRRVRCRPHEWHVQETGHGPTLLLLHGAGASCHTWRHLLPRLAATHHVVAIDVPGQGFTRLGARHRSGVETMSADIAHLCTDQGWTPDAIIGHSAGGVLAFDLALRLSPMPRVITLNAALSRFDGLAGWLFPLLAKTLAVTPLAAWAFSAGGVSATRARRLIESTGSRIDDTGIGLYARLFADRPHVEGTLLMMAQWDVAPLLRRTTNLATPCLMLTGARDKAVPPRVSEAMSQRHGDCQHICLPNAGHLLHEEAPADVFGALSNWLETTKLA